MHSSDSAVKTINVERSRLLATLTANLVTHRKEYLEARSGFETKRLELLRALATVTQAAVEINTEENRRAVHDAFLAYEHLEKPVDHSNEYEQAIALMQWETRDKIDISVSDFERFVRDNWNWKNKFKLVHSSYTTPSS